MMRFRRTSRLVRGCGCGDGEGSKGEPWRAMAIVGGCEVSRDT